MKFIVWLLISFPLANPNAIDYVGYADETSCKIWAAITNMIKNPRYYSYCQPLTVHETPIKDIEDILKDDLK